MKDRIINFWSLQLMISEKEGPLIHVKSGSFVYDKHGTPRFVPKNKNTASQLSTNESNFWKKSWDAFKIVVQVAADVGWYKRGWDDATSGENYRFNNESYEMGYYDALNFLKNQ
jgi:hypothetical protein